MKRTSHASLSARIKLERKKRSWTQEHLADLTRLSARTIQRMENGGEPSKEALRAVSDAFAIPVEDLLGSAMRKDFGAPWDKKVKIITLAVAMILITVPFLVDGLFSMLPIALLIGSLFFSIHGYSLRSGNLMIHRLGWSNSYDLAKLTEIEVNPQAMVGSIRLFGNGGLFGFMGYFRNTILGKYRAFVTHTDKCMVLKFGDQTIVISPDEPEELERAICGWLEQLAK